MASSSSISSCVHCQEWSSESLINGWKCRDGEYAQLCRKCYSVYQAGFFCAIFHSGEDGWRGCNSCKKLYHCGCIVSLSDYSLNDFGGITCADCSKINFLRAHGHLSAKANPQDLETPSNSTLIPTSDLIYLFEKSISSSDANIKTSRMVIPVQDATAFFPEIFVGQTIPLSILDTDGKEWYLNYRCWLRKSRKTYTLQGLKEFIISKNLQAGDIVTFYQRQSDDRIVMEVEKNSP